MGPDMLSKSLVQFSVDGQSCVCFLLFDLRPNYGGGNEDNGDLHCLLGSYFGCVESELLFPHHSTMLSSMVNYFLIYL